MDRLQRLFGNLPGLPGQGGGTDGPLVDTAEKVHISSLALLKMLKHGTLLCAVRLHAAVGGGLHEEALRSRRRAARTRALVCVRASKRVSEREGLCACRVSWQQEEDSLMCSRSRSAGRAGVPMEVMGLMLGEFVDDYTVNCIDVFAMPQSGTGVSVEAVDPVFQTKMLDMLKQTGRCVSLLLLLCVSVSTLMSGSLSLLCVRRLQR